MADVNPNDEQWLRLLEEPPKTRLLGQNESGTIAARREDGTGLLVYPDGSSREIAADGKPA